ncbi:hypothetical protein [Butyrivibrio sp. VCB2006]|uniref:hypothetical protein n=1 Tax=Butyrivibrio sp. VCB2006 TaxID=1280679 RepID=UPI0003FDA618|nr:hypothetical protein [Butyrivibrio sp. VCB2006]
MAKKVMLTFNEAAGNRFDFSIIDDIAPLDEYPIWSKKDAWGHSYYGVSNFYGIEGPDYEDSDLSQLEWDGNEVYLNAPDSNEEMTLFRKAIGIMKSWHKQMLEQYPEERFVILASFDDGVDPEDGCEYGPSFTLRFWKVREGQWLGKYDEFVDCEQPVIRCIIDN